jgi:hypothetical protein
MLVRNIRHLIPGHSLNRTLLINLIAAALYHRWRHHDITRGLDHRGSTSLRQASRSLPECVVNFIKNICVVAVTQSSSTRSAARLIVRLGRLVIKDRGWGVASNTTHILEILHYDQLWVSSRHWPLQCGLGIRTMFPSAAKNYWLVYLIFSTIPCDSYDVWR